MNNNTVNQINSNTVNQYNNITPNQIQNNNNKQKRQRKKLFLLMVAIVVTAAILVVGTYAWFIGINNVTVQAFSINVDSQDGLMLSLTGMANDWHDSIALTETAGNTTTFVDVSDNYASNTNKWPGNGLIPLSSIGEVTTASSNLKLFDKVSMSSTQGGFRLISRQLDNNTESPTSSGSYPEGDGYIAFDLFVRNGNRDLYDGTFVRGGDESIYLTPTSSVTVSNQNAKGLANSIRVGFFEIGRVATNTSGSQTPHATIQSIKCNSTGDVITPLCSTPANPEGQSGDTYTLDQTRTYTWNIWEPNDAAHSEALRTFFNGVCKKRTDATTYSDEACMTLAADTSLTTYAIKAPITGVDNVDIYDGATINTYPGSTTANKLSPMTTYLTSYTTETGNSKHQLLGLAGNSITKVRVYIWLEGQDVDNYDLITDDNQVTINFGFTKNNGMYGSTSPSAGS